jgi:hypothetical protein
VPPTSWSLPLRPPPNSIGALNRSKVQVLTRFISSFSDLREILRSGVALFHLNNKRVRISHGPRSSQYGEADRREVDPPIEVESATWSAGGALDWWVKSGANGWVECAVQMGARGGSERLIFVRPTTSISSQRWDARQDQS